MRAEYVRPVMTHAGGMAKPIDPADAPHNEVANPGLFTSCAVCHEPGTYVP